MNRNLIGIKTMAEKLDVPESWIYSRTRTGEIPHYKVGKYVKFNETEDQELLNVKAVTYHQLFIGRENNTWTARVFLDI